MWAEVDEDLWLTVAAHLLPPIAARTIDVKLCACIVCGLLSVSPEALFTAEDRRGRQVEDSAFVELNALSLVWAAVLRRREGAKLTDDAIWTTPEGVQLRRQASAIPPDVPDVVRDAVVEARSALELDSSMSDAETDEDAM
jgi:hypothetical protein